MQRGEIFPPGQTASLQRGEPVTHEGRVPSPEELQTLLKIHHPDDPSGSICVHLPDWGYGTRSSLVLR